MKNFLVLGGSGNLGSALKKNRFFNKRSYFPTKKELNILSLRKILSFVKKKISNWLLIVLQLPEWENVKKID